MNIVRKKRQVVELDESDGSEVSVILMINILIASLYTILFPPSSPPWPSPPQVYDLVEREETIKVYTGLYVDEASDLDDDEFAALDQPDVVSGSTHTTSHGINKL